MEKLVELFKKKPYLAWYIKDPQNLSLPSMLEHIFNYGDWSDYLVTEDTLGIQQTKKLFNFLKNKNRSNLREKTVNYFNKYFQKYA